MLDANNHPDIKQTDSVSREADFPVSNGSECQTEMELHFKAVKL